MPHRENLGFQSLPENGLKIVRSRTLLGNRRLWEIPRSEQALETIADTIDVFLRFEEDRIVLVYKSGEKDVTGYSVEPYPPANP